MSAGPNNQAWNPANAAFAADYIRKQEEHKARLEAETQRIRQDAERMRQAIAAQYRSSSSGHCPI